MFINFLVVFVTLFAVANGLKKYYSPEQLAQQAAATASNLRGADLELEAANPHMMTYRGGRVVTKPHIVPIYASLNYPNQTEITNYYKSLVKGNFVDFLSEYNLRKQKITTGTVSQPYVFDWTSPSTILGIEQIVTNVLTAISTGGLPAPRSDNNTIYAFHFEGATDYNQGSCSMPGGGYWCGVHGDFLYGPQLSATFQLIPDMNLCAGCAYNKDGLPITPEVALYSTVSHEIAEIITDPDVSSGPLTWYNDIDGEVADYCGNRVGRVELGDKKRHIVQMLWSNKQKKCAIPRK